jgi:hypothetical protein
MKTIQEIYESILAESKISNKILNLAKDLDFEEFIMELAQLSGSAMEIYLDSEQQEELYKMIKSKKITYLKILHSDKQVEKWKNEKYKVFWEEDNHGSIEIIMYK